MIPNPFPALERLPHPRGAARGRTRGGHAHGARDRAVTPAKRSAWGVSILDAAAAALGRARGRGDAAAAAAEVLMKFMSQSERKKLFSADFTHHFLSSPSPLPAAHLSSPGAVPTAPARCRSRERPERSAPLQPRSSLPPSLPSSVTRALSSCSLWLIKCQNKLPL